MTSIAESGNAQGGLLFFTETLLVCAMQDKAIVPSNIDGIKELVPDIRIERIADCGHFVTWEKPEAVIAAMQTFLAQTN